MARVIFAVVALALVAPVASVLGQGLSISIATDGLPTPWTHSPTGEPTGAPGVYHYAGSWTAGNGYWSCQWDITGDSDPSIAANITFLNPTASAQIYTLTFTQPIAPSISPSTLIGGSMAGSVTDAGFDGLGGMSTVLGTPLYVAMLDATPVLSLASHPYSVGFGFAGDSASIASTSAGLPGPTIPAGPVSSSISIQHRFELSAGDSIGLTSFFVVTPDPSTVALLTLGSLLLIRRWRR